MMKQHSTNTLAAALFVFFSVVGIIEPAVEAFAASSSSSSSSVPSAVEQELGQWPILSKGAFSAAECDSIVDLYVSKLDRVQDHREADSVSRINRFDVDEKLLKKGDLDWVLDRVVEHLPLDEDGVGGAAIESGDELKECVDFTLLHEFNPGMHFGLHVDTKPNDRTFRTFNVNIMLSDPDSYSGGALQVGDNTVSGLEKGDVYVYPASLPHAVHQLDSGRRYTYVLALNAKQSGGESDAESPDLKKQQSGFWAASEARIKALGSPTGRMGDSESKLHLIHAQLLESAGDRTEKEIDAAYCRAYKATPEAALYAKKFFDDGMAMREAGNLKMGVSHLAMAACIDPNLKEAIQALELRLEKEL